MNWYLDEGLVTFRRQWWGHHPGATVYTIGDTAHSPDPDKSQHAPDRGTSGRPGDTRGEVDAVDVMPGKGVDDQDLEDLFDDLVGSKDPRILYVIYGNTIVSSVVSPWKRRPYGGKYHSHVHLSVNDNYRANTSPWKIGDQPVRTPERESFAVELPILLFGDEDPSPAKDGRYQHVWRLQYNLNAHDRSTAALDTDGVYGAKTVEKARKVLGGDGRRVGENEWRKLFGLYVPK